MTDSNAPGAGWPETLELSEYHQDEIVGYMQEEYSQSSSGKYTRTDAITPQQAAKVLLNGMPDGDFRVEVELVSEGWVGYVYLIPGGGAIVPAVRPHKYARTSPCKTRLEAVIAIPEALSRLRAIAEQEADT